MTDISIPQSFYTENGVAHLSSPFADMPEPPPLTAQELEQRIVETEGGEQGRSILDELAAFEGDVGALRTFALDAVQRLAELTRADLVRFCDALREGGVTSTWIQRELKPAVSAARAEARHTTSTTWADYIRVAGEIGYEFRMSDLDDTLEANEQRMSDGLDSVIYVQLHERGYKNEKLFRHAVRAAANQNRYHPVHDYLNGLVWDGQDHIAQFCVHFTDAHEPITYPDGSTQTVIHAWMRRWLVGAVGKTFVASQNACVILDGEQGRGKSYVPFWLCSPLPDMHIELAIRPDRDDQLRLLTSSWIWEIAELGSTLRRADREALKSFLTLKNATYRPSYGRHPLQKPSLASFIATVNFEGNLLNDPTGHRRFRPVEIQHIDWAYSTDIDVNQVWAQAVSLWRGGETAELCETEREIHKRIVALYETEDPYETPVLEYFDVDATRDDWFTTSDAIASHLRTYGVTDSPTKIKRMLPATMRRLRLGKPVRRGERKLSGYAGIRIQTVDGFE